MSALHNERMSEKEMRQLYSILNKDSLIDILMENRKEIFRLNTLIPEIKLEKVEHYDNDDFINQLY